MSDIGNLRAVEGLSSDPDSIEASITRAARALLEYGTDEAPLIGHVSIGLYADGSYSFGWRHPSDHLIGATLFVAYVKEIVAKEMTGAMAAEDYARRFLS